MPLPSPFPVPPADLLESIADASAAGYERGGAMASNILAVMVDKKPLTNYFASIRLALKNRTPVQRMAFIEATSIRAAAVLESAAPEFVEPGSWRSPVLKRPMYETIIECARASEIERVMPFDSVVAALALRADSVSLDFAKRGYEGHPISYEAMHATTLVAISLDPAYLPMAAQYLPTFVANAAVRAPASPEAMGIIWQAMLDAPEFDPWCLEQLVNAPHFDEAVHFGHIKPTGAEGANHELAVNSVLSMMRVFGSGEKAAGLPSSPKKRLH